jgi:hypothetical protein
MKTQVRKPVHGKASYSDEYEQQALELAGLDEAGMLMQFAEAEVF